MMVHEKPRGKGDYFSSCEMRKMTGYTKRRHGEND
jgi:hypothetical protein